MTSDKHNIESHCSKQPIVIDDDISIRDAHELMRVWGVRHFPVMKGENVVGVISERDIYKKLSIDNKKDFLVSEAMMPSPYLAQVGTPLSEVAQVMAQNKIGCAVVVSGQQEVRGIFTTTDALWVLAQLLNDPGDKRFHVMSIEEYLATDRSAFVA